MLSLMNPLSLLLYMLLLMDWFFSSGDQPGLTICEGCRLLLGRGAVLVGTGGKLRWSLDALKEAAAF